MLRKSTIVRGQFSFNKTVEWIFMRMLVHTISLKLTHCSLHHVDLKPIQATMIVEHRFSPSATELFINLAFNDFCKADKTRTQGMTRKNRETLFLRLLCGDTAFEDAVLDQPCDVSAVEARVQCSFAVTRYPNRRRAKFDLRRMQPLFQSVHKARLLQRSAPNLNLAPAGF